MRGLSVLALAVCLVGCTDPEPEVDPSDSLSDQLRAGKGSTAHPEIGLFRAPTGEVCTATLVAARSLLTDAACVRFGNNNAGGTATGHTFRTDDGQIFAVDGFKSFGNKPGSVALIHLGSAIPANVAKPIPISTFAPPKGAMLDSFGFGAANCTFEDGVAKDPTGGNYQKRVNRQPFGSKVFIWCPGDSGGPQLFDNTVIAVNLAAITAFRDGQLVTDKSYDESVNVFTKQAALTAQMRAWGDKPPAPPKPPKGGVVVPQEDAGVEEEPDASPISGETPPQDEVTPQEAQPEADAGAAPPPAEPPPAADSGCSTTGNSRGSSGALLTVLAVALARLRTSRSRRRTAPH
jgi:hypothetical protein